jgi:RNA polymerase sigma-70 factor, ECF subfamily
MRKIGLNGIMSSPDQFESIVSEHYESLYRFAMSLTRSEADAADLTQETFYIWATRGHQLRDISKLRSWLFTTLHRMVLASQRRKNRFPHNPLEETLDELPILIPSLADRLDSSQVLSALAQVDQPYQAALALFYLEDYTQNEIAEILEIPVGTIKSRISRGIVQLRRIFFSGASNPPTRRSVSFKCRNETGVLVPVNLWNRSVPCEF